MIVVAVPSGDLVHAGFAVSLASLMGWCVHRGVNALLYNFRSSNIACSRFQIVEFALRQEGATHAFWLDSDIEFPKDALDRLLSAKMPIVGAGYMRRQEPYTPAFARFAKRAVSGRFESVEWLAGGCLLVDLNVYRTLGRPYGYECRADESGVPCSEDVSFCRAAREHGFEIWMDRGLSAELVHLGESRHVLTSRDILGVRA
jgi:hypothetical protein